MPLPPAPAATVPLSAPDPVPPATSKLRGILFMILAAMTVSVMHVLVRYTSTSAGVHPLEIAFFRNLTTLCILAPLLLRQGRSGWKSARPGLQAVRGFVGSAAMLTWFYSLYLLPVADATVLSFTAVIVTSLGAILVLGERVGPRRWIAIAVGLAGTLIILRPGVQVVSVGSLMVLLSTCLWSISLLVVKVLSRTDSSVTIVFYSAMYFTPLSFIPALFVWQWPTVAQVALMILIGVLASISHLSMTQALKLADATLVMPLDFTRLIWAAGIGYLVFGEFPDFWTWVGGAVIVASAVYITYRESRAKKVVTPEAAIGEPIAR